MDLSPFRPRGRDLVFQMPSVSAQSVQALTQSASTLKSLEIGCFAISSIMSRGRTPKWVETYVDYWLRHPDEGSSFERVAQRIRWLPSKVLLPLMRMMGYDGLLCRDGERVVAHLFCQRHGTALHMFSVWVAPDLQGRGLGTKLVASFVEWARSRAEIESVRLGAGGDPKVQSIVRRLSTKGSEMGLAVDERCFVRFLDRNQRLGELVIGSTRSISLGKNAGSS